MGCKEERDVNGMVNVFLTAVLTVLAVLVMLCLVRAIRGPRVADRIVAANMMGTMVIVMIAVLSVMLGEGYLVDICIIYAMISFLAVIVLTKVYMGVYLEKKELEASAGQAAGRSAAESGKSPTGQAEPKAERAAGQAEPETTRAAGQAEPGAERAAGQAEPETTREVEPGAAGAVERTGGVS